MKNYLSYDKVKKLNIILAPNAFKGTLEAQEFCRILAEEFEDTPFQVCSYPLCDGGDGSAKIISSYFKAKPVSVNTYDALGREHTVIYYIFKDTAIIDIADICGLKGLAVAEYDVMNANTSGLGVVICDAVKKSCRKILLGVGGSASIDGGIGALEKMGLKITNLPSSYQNHLIYIKDIYPDLLKQNFKNIEFLLLCDVDNQLCGPKGAVRVFGPQKGASLQQVNFLEKELLQYAQKIRQLTHTDVTTLKYGGAAGGIAAAFAALLNARLISGAIYCLQLSGLEHKLPYTKLVITGEGKLDDQSLQGKLPGAVASLCQRYRVPIIAIAGSSVLSSSPFQRVYNLIDYAENLPAAMRQPGYYLRCITKEIKNNLLNLI